MKENVNFCLYPSQSYSPFQNEMLLNILCTFLENFSYAHLNIHVWITINLYHTKHDVLQFDVFHFQCKVYLGRLIHKPLPYRFYGYPVYNLSHNDCHLSSLPDFFWSVNIIVQIYFCACMKVSVGQSFRSGISRSRLTCINI